MNGRCCTGCFWSKITVGVTQQLPFWRWEQEPNFPGETTPAPETAGHHEQQSCCNLLAQDIHGKAWEGATPWVACLCHSDAPRRFWSISLKRSAKIHSHTWCELIPNHGYFRAFWKGFISIWKYVAKIVLEVFHFLRFGNKTPLTKQNFGWSEKALRFFGFFSVRK